ncbi:hypothetical protein pb186bvf_001826 [Paramecium bursaria]
MQVKAKQKIFNEPDLNIQERRCTIQNHKNSVIIAFKIKDTLQYQCLYCKKDDELNKESQNLLQLKQISIIDVGKLILKKYGENKQNLAKIIQKQFNFTRDVRQQLLNITNLFAERMEQFKKALKMQYELNKIYESVLEYPEKFYQLENSIQKQMLVFDSNKMYNTNLERMNLWLQQVRNKLEEVYSEVDQTFQKYLPKQLNPPKQQTQSEIIGAKNLMVLNEAREAYLLQDYKKASSIILQFDYNNNQTKSVLLALYLKGKVQFQNKNYDESMNTFQSVISMDDKFYRAYYRQAECFYQKYLEPPQRDKDGQLREATKKCLELIKLNPNHIKAYLLFVIIIKQKKEPPQLKQGIDLINQVLKNNTYNYKLLKKKAYLHFLLQEYDQSIQIYEMILQKETKGKNCYYTMAILQFTKKNIEQTLKYIRKALVIDTKYMKARDILTDIYIKYPNTKPLMLQEINLCIIDMPNDIDLKLFKLNILKDLKKLDEAENLEFEIAILKSKGL